MIVLYKLNGLYQYLYDKNQILYVWSEDNISNTIETYKRQNTFKGFIGIIINNFNIDWIKTVNIDLKEIADMPVNDSFWISSTVNKTIKGICDSIERIEFDDIESLRLYIELEG